MYKEYYLADLITPVLSVYRLFVKFTSSVRTLFVPPFAEALVSNYALIVVSNRQYIKTESIHIKRAKVFPLLNKDISDSINN